jgi:hypothetical protein
MNGVVGVSLNPDRMNLMVNYARAVRSGEASLATARFRTALMQQLPEIVDESLANWSRMNHTILSMLPQNKSLIVRTHEISRSIPRIAGFIGIEESSLRAESSHLNKGQYRLDLLRDLDDDFLRERVEYHCGDLMTRFFPEYPVGSAARDAERLETPSER